jgi:hypothetical protein
MLPKLANIPIDGEIALIVRVSSMAQLQIQIPPKALIQRKNDYGTDLSHLPDGVLD